MTLWLTIPQVVEATGLKERTVRRWKLHDTSSPPRICLTDLPKRHQGSVIDYYEEATGDSLDREGDRDISFVVEELPLLDQPEPAPDLDLPMMELRQLSTEALLLRGISASVAGSNTGKLVSLEHMLQAERLANILRMVRPGQE